MFNNRSKNPDGSLPAESNPAKIKPKDSNGMKIGIVGEGRRQRNTINIHMAENVCIICRGMIKLSQ